MPTAITITDLENAKVDVDHIAAIATSTALTATDRLGRTKKTMDGAIATISTIVNRGAWASTTAYLVMDIVLESSTWYICVVAHTSSALFATDVASKWRVYQGITPADIGADDFADDLGFIAAGAGAVSSNVGDALREVVRISVTSRGALGDNTTDDYAAFLSAYNDVVAAGGGTVVVPQPAVAYKVGTALPLSDGVAYEGVGGMVMRWRSTMMPIRIRCTGATAGVKLTPGASTGIDTFQIRNLIFDGVDATGTCHGLYCDAAAADSYIEGGFLHNSSFINFPGHQLYSDGVVFDIVADYCSFLNPDQAADDIVRIENSNASQFEFNHCYILQYTTGKWCVYAEGQDIKFIGGSAAPYDGTTGANGIYVNGGLQIEATHVEGPDDTDGATIGIQYLGSNGAIINPSHCAYFGRGIVIGDGTAAAARGWSIGGLVGNNNVGVTPGTTCDIYITAGGSRTGSILNTGFADGAPTIIDKRADTDGVYEVVRTNEGKVQGLIQGYPGSIALPGVSVGAAGTHGLSDLGGGVMGISAAATKVAEVRSTDLRMNISFYPPALTGGMQVLGKLWFSNGVPNNANGTDGDFAINTAGGAGTTGYLKVAGAWSSRF